MSQQQVSSPTFLVSPNQPATHPPTHSSLPLPNSRAKVCECARHKETKRKRRAPNRGTGREGKGRGWSLLQDKARNSLPRTYSLTRSLVPWRHSKKPVLEKNSELACSSPIAWRPRLTTVALARVGAYAHTNSDISTLRLQLFVTRSKRTVYSELVGRTDRL